jgi:DNA polymerase/3'-5' exonuclease PolX
MVETLSFSSDDREIDLKDFSKNLQTGLTDTTAVFNQLLKERMGTTDPLAQGLFSGEMDELYQEANNVALDNKLEIISEYIGEPVINADLSNMRDLALVADMARSQSFTNRKKKFYDSYPDGEFIRQQVTIGDRTLDLELFKYDKSDKEYKMVDGFGMNYSDFAEVMGQVVNTQLVGEGVGLFAGSKVGMPTAGVILGSYLGLKGDKLIEYMRGYGEDEFAGGFDMGQFFTEYDDLFSAAISGGLYKLTKSVGDILFIGKRPGTIELTPTITAAANRLGLDPLVFAQLAVNPQIRNIFTQSEGFTSTVPNTKIKQRNSIINSFKTGGNPFDELDIEGNLKFDLQDLINTQTALANDAKKFMKVNFGLKDGVANIGEADQALAGIIKNFNLVNKKFQNRYLTNVNKAAQSSGDFSVNLNGFNQVMVRELNDLFSGVRTADRVVKQRVLEDGEFVVKNVLVEGRNLKSSYTGIKDLPKEFQNVVKNIKAMGSKGFNVTKDKDMLNLKTLYNAREDLYKLMHTDHKDAKINLAAEAMYNNIVKLLDPKNGFIKGSDEAILNMKILNGQVRNNEVVNGMDMIRTAFIKGNDLDGFVSSMIKPGNTNNIAAIQQMIKLPDEASATDKRVADKFFNTLKNYWIVNTARADGGAKILDDFMLKDQDSLKILMGPNYETKVNELQKLMELNNVVENGLINKAISTKATANEFTNKIIKDASKGDFGTAKSIDELIVELGGFDGKIVNDVRNNIMKDLFQKSLKIEERSGSKELIKEVLDVKSFADNVQALRKNPNLLKFFNNDQIEALKAYEQYSRAIGGNLGVGGELAKAEQTSRLVQKFDLVGTGITILKYKVLAELMSRPVTAKTLKELTPDGITPNNLKILQTALIGLERELVDSVTGYNRNEDQGIVNEYEINKMNTNRAPIMDSTVVDSNVREIPLANVQANPASRIGATNVINPAGMQGTPTADTGTVDPALLARGREFFPDSITFASKGGIMNSKKAFQRVA